MKGSKDDQDGRIAWNIAPASQSEFERTAYFPQYCWTLKQSNVTPVFTVDNIGSFQIIFSLFFSDI